MISHFEYDIARIAYGDIGGTLHCMKKMEASPEDYDYVFFNNQSDIFTKAMEEPQQQQQPPQPPPPPQPNQQVPAPFSTGAWNTTGGSGQTTTEVPGIGDVRGQQGDMGFGSRARRAMRTRGSDVSYEPTTSLFGRTTAGGRDEGAGYTYTDPQSGQTTRVAPGMTDRARDWLGRRGDQIREFGRVNLGREGRDRRRAQANEARVRADISRRVREGSGLASRFGLSPALSRDDLAGMAQELGEASSHQTGLPRRGQTDERPTVNIDNLGALGRRDSNVPPPPPEAPAEEMDPPPPPEAPAEGEGTETDPNTGLPPGVPPPPPPEGTEPAPEGVSDGWSREGGLRYRRAPPEGHDMYPGHVSRGARKGEWKGEGEEYENPGWIDPIPKWLSRSQRHKGQQADKRKGLTPLARMTEAFTEGGGRFTDPATGQFVTDLSPMEEAWGKLRGSPPNDTSGQPLWEANNANSWKSFMRDLRSLIDRAGSDEYAMEFLSRISPSLSSNREAMISLMDAAKDEGSGNVGVTRGKQSVVPPEASPDEMDPPTIDPNAPPEAPPDEMDPPTNPDAPPPEAPAEEMDPAPKGMMPDSVGRPDTAAGAIPSAQDIISELEGVDDDDDEPPPPVPKTASSDPLSSAWDHLTLLKEGDE